MSLLFIGITVVMGFISGFVTGMTGASGVMIMVPVLTLLYGVPLHMAIGTSLLLDVFASIGIAYLYWKNGHIKTRFMTWLIIGALLGTQIGAFTSVSFFSERMLSISLVIFMIGLAWRMWTSGLRMTEKKQRTWIQEKLDSFFESENPVVSSVSLLILGTLFGILTGLFGAGGGILIFTVLYFIFDFDLKTAVGTSAIAMLVIALAGGLAYVREGAISQTVLLWGGVGTLIGGILSATQAQHISEHALSRLIAVMYAGLGIAIGVVEWMRF